jgi:hypothetical protein
MVINPRPSFGKPKHRFFSGLCYPSNQFVSEADYVTAAKKLGCEVNAIKAVAQVESDAGGWNLGKDRPKVLFERHYFSHLTNGIYDISHPDLSNKIAGGYGGPNTEYDKLYRAAHLNEEAALKSASYGAFQIVGRYHIEAGSATVSVFVDRMMRGQREQLFAFVSYVAAKNSAKRAIINKDWARFALSYNGPAYRRNNYDTKMARAYAVLQKSSARKRP